MEGLEVVAWMGVLLVTVVVLVLRPLKFVVSAEVGCLAERLAQPCSKETHPVAVGTALVWEGKALRLSMSGMVALTGQVRAATAVWASVEVPLRALFWREQVALAIYPAVSDILGRKEQV